MFLHKNLLTRTLFRVMYRFLEGAQPLGCEEEVFRHVAAVLLLSAIDKTRASS